MNKLILSENAESEKQKLVIFLFSSLSARSYDFSQHITHLIVDSIVLKPYLNGLNYYWRLSKAK